MKMKQLVVLLAVLVLSYAKKTEVEKANDFVDETITNRADELAFFDIPSKVIAFKMPFGGEWGVRLHGANITNLENLKRTRESVVRETADDHRETYYYIGVKNLKLYAQASYVFYLKYSIHFEGKLDELEVEIRTLTNKKSKLRALRSVKVTKFAGFDLSINAPGIVVDTVVNTGLSASKIAYKPVLRYFIAKHIQGVVNDEIEARNKIVG